MSIFIICLILIIGTIAFVIWAIISLINGIKIDRIINKDYVRTTEEGLASISNGLGNIIIINGKRII